MLDEKKRIDWAAWARLGIYIASMVGAIYAHIANTEIHKTTTELADIFVLRREYDSNVAALRDDIKWVKSEMIRISDKIDRLVERNQK